MHPMLRLLLNHPGTRRLATQALKRLRQTPRHQSWLRDERDLARHLDATRTRDETPQQAIQRVLEERHAARVTVNLDPRGVTLTPRDQIRPAHRLLYPIHLNAITDSAKRVEQAGRERREKNPTPKVRTLSQTNRYNKASPKETNS